MKPLLAIAAAAEAATGLALIASPPLVGKLLLGAEFAGAGIAVSRVAGIALVGLGIACWPGGASRALAGMFTYSLLVTLYLAWLGLAGGMAGQLLWPAVGLHVVLTALLARGFFQPKNPHRSSP